jgi:hypothetical protein
MIARVHVKRAAGYTWTSKFDQALEDFEKACKFKDVFSEKDI